MAYNVTTEWEDVQVKHGNYVPTMIKVDHYKEETSNTNKFLEMTNYGQDIIIEGMKIEDKNEDDEDWLDDNDMAFEEEYKRKKMMELGLYQNEVQIKEIYDMKEYNDLILKGNLDKAIILVLFQDHASKSVHFTKELHQFISNSQAVQPFKNRIVIFKMIATSCIPNFEDNDTPSVLIFMKGVILKKYIGCFPYFMESSTGTAFNHSKGKEIEDIIIKVIQTHEKMKGAKVLEDNFVADFVDTYKTQDKESGDSTLIKDDREYHWKK